MDSTRAYDASGTELLNPEKLLAHPEWLTDDLTSEYWQGLS